MKAGFITAVAITAVSLLTLGGQLAVAQQAEKVTLAYSFTPDGTNTNLVAVADRFAKAEGLDLDLITPGSGADAIKLVASNTVQFSIVGPPAIVGARSRGVPISCIVAQHQFSSIGLMASAESGIKAVKDLTGKTVGVTGVPANRAMLDQMLRANNVDIDSVKIVDVGYGGIPMLAAGRIDAVEAISLVEPFELNVARGKPLSDTSTSAFFAFAKNGAPPYYYYTIVVTDDYKAHHADTIRKFLKAWQAGTEWSIKNPEEAVQLFIKHYPESKYDMTLAEWKAVVDVSRSPDTSAHGLGWQDPEVWAKFVAFMSKSKLTVAPVDPATVFTNDFLPK